MPSLRSGARRASRPGPKASRAGAGGARASSHLPSLARRSRDRRAGARRRPDGGVGSGARVRRARRARRTAAPSTSAAPTLSVGATDPDGGSLEVTLRGPARRARPCPGRRTRSRSRSSSCPTPRTTATDPSTCWMRSCGGCATRAARSTRPSSIQVGDLVSEWDIPRHWDNVSRSFAILDDAGVPNTVVPGNHDFDNATGDLGPYNATSPPPATRARPGTRRPPATAATSGRTSSDPIRSTAATATATRCSARAAATSSCSTSSGRRRSTRSTGPTGCSTPTPTAPSSWRRTASCRSTARVARPRSAPAARRRPRCGRGSCAPTARSTSSSPGTSTRATSARRTAPTPTRAASPCRRSSPTTRSRANGGDGWLRYYTFEPADEHDARDDVLAHARPLRDRRGLRVHAAVRADRRRSPRRSRRSRPGPWRRAARPPRPGRASRTTPRTSGARSSTTARRRTTSPTWTLRTPPAPQAVLAADAFGRTVTGGWGTADVGGAWTPGTGTTGPLSVNGSAGAHDALARARRARCGSARPLAPRRSSTHR